MWMLADTLQRYHPILRIEDGEQILQNARILSDSTKMSRYTVYLSQLEENRIMCINGHDLITVECDDIQQLLDDVLDTFERYNEWANHVYEHINENCTALDLLQDFHQFTKNYYLLADSTFYVLEQYGDPQLLTENPVYETILDRRIMPVEILLSINKNRFIRFRNQATYRIPITEINCVPSVSNLFVLNSHKGWLISINSENIFSRGEMQLQDEMRNMTEKWLLKNETLQDSLGITGLFLDILNESYTNQTAILHRLSGFSWNENDPKVIYIIQQSTVSDENNYFLDRNLELLHESSFVFRYQNHLLLLVNYALTEQQQFEKKLTTFMNRYDSFAGKSSIFTDIFQLNQHYHSALIAIQYTNPQKAPIIALEQIVLPYCAHLLREKSLFDLKHPALKLLSSYDRDNGTELYHTLYIFLQSNHNYKIASERLFIHRTTLMYRLTRIIELTQIDLEDYETQMHLNISYLLDKTR